MYFNTRQTVEVSAFAGDPTEVELPVILTDVGFMAGEKPTPKLLNYNLCYDDKHMMAV